jgi:hypothetical protein
MCGAGASNSRARALEEAANRSAASGVAQDQIAIFGPLTASR